MNGKRFEYHYQRKKMPVYQLDRPGSLDGLVVVERNVPLPAVGEVPVRVRASSLNVRDLMIINGEYPMPVPPGRVPLSDGAGEVVAVGAGVTRFKVADRVINSFFPNWFGGTFSAMPVQYVVDCDGWLASGVQLPPWPPYFKARSLNPLRQAETNIDAVSGIRMISVNDRSLPALTGSSNTLMSISFLKSCYSHS
jgi:hypothetical protein